jgi:hypothetical protein
MTQLAEAGVVAGFAAGVLGVEEFEVSLEEDVESLELVEAGVVDVLELVDALEEDPRLSFL